MIEEAYKNFSDILNKPKLYFEKNNNKIISDNDEDKNIKYDYENMNNKYESLRQIN